MHLRRGNNLEKPPVLQARDLWLLEPSILVMSALLVWILVLLAESATGLPDAMVTVCVAIAGPVGIGSVMSSAHRSQTSAALDSAGVRFTSLLGRTTTVPWQSVRGISLHRADFIKQRWSVFFHIASGRGITGYTVPACDEYEAVSFVRAAAARVAAGGTEVQVGPLLHVADRSVVCVAIRWLVLIAVPTVAVAVVSQHGSMAFAGGTWIAVAAIPLALLSRSSLRRRVLWTEDSAPDAIDDRNRLMTYRADARGAGGPVAASGIPTNLKLYANALVSTRDATRR